MDRFAGVGASPGIGIGPAFPLDVAVVVAERRISAAEVDAEVLRFDRAVVDADRQLARLQDTLDQHHGRDGHAILEAHRLMQKDDDLVGQVKSLIRDERLSAEWSLRRTLDRIAATFAGLEDPYFRERGSDMEALGDRLLRVLLGLPELRPGGGAAPGSIVVGQAIGPVDAFALKRAGVAGIATEGGGKTSHAAILARALGLPYVVGLKRLAGHIDRGDTVIIDGGRGEVVVRPDAETLRDFQSQAERARARAEVLKGTAHLASVTLDGVPIQLAANLEALSEVPAALELGAQAVGLFRTEFLYLERTDLPSEEDQYRDAVAVIQRLAGRTVTFRTLDLAGDKLPTSLRPASERNPALGSRSIRFSLRHPDIFRTQLRALYRASAVGPIRIMFPLIAGVTEMRQARAACHEVAAELSASGQQFDPNVPIGAMVETPSAALTADHLVRSCDFLSIGTNDLIQYAFAADRENEAVSDLYRPLHPAVLRMLKQIIQAGRHAGKPVSVCGDMAGDPAYTWILMGLGLRELSLVPLQIPVVKGIIRASTLAEAEQLAARAMALNDEVEVETLVQQTMTERFGSAS